MKVFKINDPENPQDKKQPSQPESVDWKTIGYYALLFFICWIITKDAFEPAGRFWLAVSGVAAIGCILYYMPLIGRWLDRNKDL